MTFEKWIETRPGPYHDYGYWWVKGSTLWPRWRVTWVESTGELYAKELVPTNARFVVLGVYPTKAEIDARMAGWGGKTASLNDFFPEIA